MLNNFYLQESTNGQYWTPKWANVFRAYALWHEKLAVPGFSFLSGYFGKKFLSFEKSSRWTRTVSTFLIGTIYVQTFEIVMRWILKGLFENVWDFPQTIQFWDHLETWYLLALFIWRFCTPLLSLLRHPFWTSMAFAFFHVHMSYGNPAEFRMRVFRFFPYYVAGIVLDGCYLKEIPKPTLLGLVGVAATLFTCYKIKDQDKYLGIVYSGANWSLDYLSVFLFQYMFCGAIFLSLILLVRQIPFSLFPYSHTHSTLAVYVWHWHIMNPLLFGTYPFSDIKFTTSQPLMNMMQNYHPLVGIIAVHFISYIICTVLGSQLVWRVLKHVSAPECAWLFESNHPTTAKQKGEHKLPNNCLDEDELLIPKCV